MIKKTVLSLVAASTLLVAAQPDLKKDDLLVTHTELGYISTSGNTKTETFNLDAKIKKGWGAHIFTMIFDGQYATDNNVESKNKFFAELEYDYEFTERFAFDYLTGYKQDKFSSFDYQAYTGPGAKYKAIMGEVHNLSLEGNILYSRDEVMEVRVDGNGDIISYPYTNPALPVSVQTASYSDDYAAARLKAVYSWQILENLKFDQEASYRVDLEETSKYFVYSKTGLTSKLSDIFSAGISYKIDYVNEAGDKAKTDKTFTVGIIIDY